MSCETYIRTRPVPSCSTSLVIGTVDENNAELIIYIEKQNGKRTAQETTTSASGVVTLDLTDPSSTFYNEFEGLYKVQVGEDYETPLDITIGTETGKTVGISFVNIAGGGQTSATLVTE